MPVSGVIRELLVRLGVYVQPTTKKQIADLDQALEKLKGQMEDTARVSLRVAKGIAAMAIAGATAIGGLAIATGEHALEVERESRALGVSREHYQELTYESGQYGLSTQELSRALLALDRASYRAQQGSKVVSAAFREIGIQTSELHDMDPADLFDRLATGALHASNRTRALAALSQILGRGVVLHLAPALLSGAEGMKELRQQAHEFGLVMDDDALRTAKEAAVQFRLLKAAGKGLANELGVALAPLVTEVLKGIVGWVRANRELMSQRIEFWVRQLTRAVNGANDAVHLIGGWEVVFFNVATGAGLLYLIANLEKVEKILGAIRAGFVLVQIVAEPVLETLSAGAAGLGFELTPLLLVLAALALPITLIALAVDDFLTFWRGGKSVLGDNLDTIQRYVPAFGAVRELFRALIGLGGAGWRSITLLANAVITGLGPAFTLLGIALQPVIDGLNEIVRLWGEMNALAAAPLEAAAAWVRALGGEGEASAQGAAPGIQRGVARSVQGQVSRITNSSSSTDNSNRQVSQTNNFFGGGGADHVRNLDAAMRKAGVAVAGGRR